MKKLISMLLSAVICTCCLVGCGSTGSNDSKDTPPADSWDKTNQYVIGYIEFSLPSNAEENTGEDEDPSLYRTFDCGDFGFSCQYIKGEMKGPSSDVNFQYNDIEGRYTININSNSCVYFKLKGKDTGKPMVRLYVNSEFGCVIFDFYNNNDSTYLVENMKEFSKTIRNNIPYEETTTTTTTKATTTTVSEPSVSDLFYEKYSDLPSWKDVKYDPSKYKGDCFIITLAEFEIDDYFNYAYRDTESTYFCVHVTPDGGYYSDSWYVYFNRKSFSNLYDVLMNGNTYGAVVARVDDYESAKAKLVTAVAAIW